MPVENSEALAAGEAQQLVEHLYALKAEWPSEPALRTLSPQTVDALMKRVANTERSLVIPIQMGYMFHTLLPMGLAILVLSIPDLSWHIKQLFTAFMLALILGGLCFCRRTFYGVMGGKWPYSVYALTQTDDVRVLETLILATRYKWGRHPEVLSAINRLLEQVTEADAGLLSDRALQRLWTVGITWQTFAQPYNHAGAIRALRALAAVGNRATMARMERFAYSSEYFLGERYAKAATRDLLPLMEARMERQQVPATLLRASGIIAQPDTLLRAVAISAPAPPAQLLRASTSEHSETDA